VALLLGKIRLFFSHQVTTGDSGCDWLIDQLKSDPDPTPARACPRVSKLPVKRGERFPNPLKLMIFRATLRDLYGFDLMRKTVRRGADSHAWKTIMSAQMNPRYCPDVATK
jgi:hypothetical protein